MTKLNKYFFRIIAVVLILQFIICVPVLATDDVYVFEPKVAMAVFNKNTELTNCKIKPESGSLNIVKQNDVYVHQMSGGQSLFLQLLIDDGYWFEDAEEQTAEITVEYLDIGTGYFTLRRQSLNQLWNDSAESVRLTDTGELKSHTFYVTDMLLMNGLNGSDFVIGTYSTNYGHGAKGVYVHSVKIEKVLRKDPIAFSMDSGRVGNILSATDSSVVDFKMKNEAICDLDSTLEYTITDYDGNFITEGTHSFEIKKDEEKVIQIDTKADRFNCYNMDVKINSHKELVGLDYKTEQTKRIQFSRALTWEKGDERNQWFWFAAHLNRYNEEADVQLLSRSGAYGVRGEFASKWDIVEQKKGSYAFTSQGKNIIKMLDDEDLHYIHLLTYGNSRYSNYGRPYRETEPPEDPKYVEAYGQYAGWLAANGGKNMYALEMWNEFNDMSDLLAMQNGIDSSEMKKIYKGKAYIPLLEAVKRNMKKNNPDVRLIGGTTAGIGLDFHEEVFKNDGAQYTNAISAHPYSFHMLGKGIPYLKKSVTQLRELMDSYNMQEQPIILTETGWFDSIGDAWFGNVTSVEQAEFAVKAPITLKAHDLVELFTYYCMHETGNDATYKESRFGITRYHLSENPFAAKPGYIAVCAMNHLMPNAECSGIIEDDEGLNVAYKYDRTQGDNIMVMWAEDKKNVLKTYNLGCDTVELFDMYGNSMGIIYGDNGKFTFNLSERPQYAVGKFNSFEEADNNTVISYSEFKSAASSEACTVNIMDSRKRNLTLSIDTTYAKNNAKVIEKTDMVNGEAKVIFDIGATTGHEHEIWFTLKDKEKTVAVFPVDFEVTEPISVSISSEQNDEIGSRWYTVLSVDNLLEKNSVSGVARIISPETYTNAEVKFSDVEPGTTRKIYFNAPMMLKKRSSVVKAEISFDNGYKWQDEFRIDFSIAPYAKIKPTLDGIIGKDEWNENFWVYADSKEDADIIDNGTEPWNGPDDVSLKAKFKYDEKNLYILTVVKDNIFAPNTSTSPENIWDGDGLQLGLEDRNGKGISNSSYTELGVALHQGKPVLYRWSSISDDPAGIIGDFEGSVIRDEIKKETTYEFAIPWTAVYGEDYVLDETYPMGFSMLANDADSGKRKGWIQYNFGIGRDKDAKEFGKLNFVRN